MKVQAEQINTDDFRVRIHVMMKLFGEMDAHAEHHLKLFHRIYILNFNLFSHFQQFVQPAVTNNKRKG